MTQHVASRAHDPSPYLREIAERIQKLSFRDMTLFCDLVVDDLTETRQINCSEIIHALLTAADTIQKDAD